MGSYHCQQANGSCDGACAVKRGNARESPVDIRKSCDLLLHFLDLPYQSSHCPDVLEGSLLVYGLRIDEITAEIIVNAVDSL